MKLLRKSRFAVPLLSALLLWPASPVMAIDPNEMFADPAKEQRARDIGRQLRCLKCQNQSIFDSNAGIAKDLRVAVRDRMEAGDSDEEILNYVSERFGDFVLLDPRVDTQTYILWSAPFVLMGLGGLGLVAYLRGRSSGPTISALTAEDREEARRILDKEGA